MSSTRTSSTTSSTASSTASSTISSRSGTGRADARGGEDHTSTDRDAHRYVQPGWFTRRVFNPAIARAVRLGLSFAGARELQVRGRTSGEWRTTPVNPLEIDGHTYLVAPRGQTEWVKNLRVAGGGRLRAGRRVEHFSAVELADADKTTVLREYLRRWAWEVGQFFDELRADSSDAELLAAAPGFPVFEIRVG